MRAARVLVFIGLAAAAASCGSSSSSTDSSTTAPTVTRVTTTLSGTVQVKGADVQTVTLTQSGQVDVTLVSTTPPVVMGLGVGTLDPLNNCVIIPGASANVAGASVAQLSGIFSPGTLCVQVKDIGQATSPVSYTVTVLHP